VKVRTLIAAAVVAVAATALAGCGGADDTHGGDGVAAASSGGGSAKLSLVAYSTPQVVYDEVIPGFRETAAGRGVSFSESFVSSATLATVSRTAGVTPSLAAAPNTGSYTFTARSYDGRGGVGTSNAITISVVAA